MANLKEVVEFTKGFLQKYCTKLEEKKENDKHLFFCRNYLLGAVIKIDENKVAATVYAPKMGDRLIKEFREEIMNRFKEDVLEQDVKMSGALNENFYYQYNWMRLSE